ncbi:MAG: lysylphosphatidylglycerol synthase domain-containing protein [Candidatus Omnitrophota bacterium]
MIHIFAALIVILLCMLINRSFAKKFSFLLFFLKPVREKLTKLYDAIHRYRHNKKVAVQSVAISILSQVLYFSSICALAKGIGTPIAIRQVFLRMPIVCAIGLVPSIGGLGVREGAIVLLFQPLVGKEAAFALSILALVLLMTAGIIGGIIYAFSPQFRIKAVAKESLS